MHGQAIYHGQLEKELTDQGFMYFVEALVYQLFKGDQYYLLGTILTDKFAEGCRNVS